MGFELILTARGPGLARIEGGGVDDILGMIPEMCSKDHFGYAVFRNIRIRVRVQEPVFKKPVCKSLAVCKNIVCISLKHN